MNTMGEYTRSTVTFDFLAKENKWTYMPCLSTCLSHSEPSVNDRPQNSHGKRFSGGPLSGNIMESGKGKHSLCIFKCQGKKWPLSCCSNSSHCSKLEDVSLGGKKTYPSTTKFVEMQLLHMKMTLQVTNHILNLKVYLQTSVIKLLLTSCPCVLITEGTIGFWFKTSVEISCW